EAIWQSTFSLSHLIRPCQDVGRNGEADLLGCFEIDDQLEFHRLLDRKISRLGAFQYLVHVYSSRNSILGRSVFVQLTSSKKKISVVAGEKTSASFPATTA